MLPHQLDEAGSGRSFLPFDVGGLPPHHAARFD
jgi:hypothetical protein